MAEGFAKQLNDSAFTFYSAGTKKHGLNYRAVKVMSEVGVDISNQFSKTVDELPKGKIDFVFTVCQDAHENCPYFPEGKTIHVGFDDPPRLTNNLTNEEDILNIYRRVRDEIKDFVDHIKDYLNE